MAGVYERGLSVLTRFANKVVPEPNSGCFLWIGTTSRLGYGVFFVGRNQAGKRVTMKAHRFAYEIECGQIPDGLTIDHKCRVTCCVNPRHLRPMPMVENVMIGDGACAEHARQTHCKRGHPLSGDNVFIRKRGHRGCRICQRRAGREWMRKKRREQRAGL